MKCRHCQHPLEHVFLDLGFAPPSNAYLSEDELHRPEAHFPLRLFVCDRCWLVQTEDYARADELFRPDYAYFSSVSATWREHAARYCAMIRERLRLDVRSFVIEVASNDGYLLKHFVAANIPCLGIEPTASTATAAQAHGVPVLREFFGASIGAGLAATGKQADLIICNNVYAHVPDINDFTAGLKAALKPDGMITIEFPHLMRLIDGAQFDTVYHEHFSYLSLHTVSLIFAVAGLRVCDVEELPTHGGSLRVYGCHADRAAGTGTAVAALLDQEQRHGLRSLRTYGAFQRRAENIRDDLCMFLIAQKRSGRRVAGYGAAAKGSTLLNFAGIKPDLLPYICDAAPSKQGRLMPGSHIPIVAPELLEQDRPDHVLILPWNIADEVKKQLEYVGSWGGRFVIAVPTLRIL